MFNLIVVPRMKNVYYKAFEKVESVFEPQDEAGVSYINKELMIKYIQVRRIKNKIFYLKSFMLKM